MPGPMERAMAATGSDPGHCSLDELPDDSAAPIRTMLAAADVILDCQRELRASGRNIVGEVLRGQGTFVEFNHYPDDDVFDAQSQSQYYYHAHRGMAGEHGHFHTFLRRPGMPEGIAPIAYPATEPWPSGDDALSHLLGISMDAWGEPTGLFTTNRWVTGETWYRADDVISMLGRFRIGHSVPCAPVNRWISAMFVLFRPQMEALLHVRDAAIADWAARNSGRDVFEDRELDITSQVPISVEVQISRLRAALELSAVR